MRTARFGTLTYTRSGGEAEDITVFDRKRRRNIAVYASGASSRRAAAASTARTSRSTTTSSTTPCSANFDPRSRVDRGPHGAPAAGAGGRARHADAAAGGVARRPQHHGAGLRAAAGAARQGPEQRDRQPAAHARPRRRADARGQLRRPPARRHPGARGRIAPSQEVLGRGSRDHRRAAARSTANRSYWYPQAPVTDYATGDAPPDRAGARPAWRPASPAIGQSGPRRGPAPAARPGGSTSSLVERPARYFSRPWSPGSSRPATTEVARAPTAAECGVDGAAPTRGRWAAAGAGRARRRRCCRPTPRSSATIPYPTLHARAGRRSAAGRPQPGLLRAAPPAAADHARSPGATIR